MIVFKRFSSYTVDVYLLKKYKLGNVGQVVTVKPGYARNTLLPGGYGILMGEGKFRKVLPVIEQNNFDNKTVRITARAIAEELNRLLTMEVPDLKVQERLPENKRLKKHKALPTEEPTEKLLEAPQTVAA